MNLLRLDRLSDNSLVFLILFVALLLRITYLFLSGGFYSAPIEDSMDYHIHAQNLKDLGEFFGINEYGQKVFSSRPPALPFLLSLFYFFDYETNFIIGRFLQIVISVVSIYMVFLISRLMGLRSSFALTTSVFLCLYPPSIFYSSRILTENLAAFLVLISFYFFLKYYKDIRIKYLLISSIAFAFLTSTRSSYLLLPFFIFGLFFLKSLSTRRGNLSMKHLSLFLIFYIICLSPWAIRNYIQHDELVPTTTRLGYMLYLSNNTLDDPEVQKGGYSRKGELFYDEEFQLLDPVYKSEVYTDEAMEQILENPQLFLSASKERFLNTLTWRPNPIARDEWITSDYIMFFIWLPILLLFFLTILRISNFAIFLMWSFFLYVLLLSLFFWGIPRLRFPIDPLMIVGAVSSLSILKKNQIKKYE